MAKLVTLGEIKTRAREMSDMVNSGFINDAELTRFINSSAEGLYDLLVAAFGEDYYVSPAPFEFTTNANNDPVGLPDDFYKLAGVDVSVNGGNDWTTAKPFMFNQRNAYNGPFNWYPDIVAGLRYRIVGNQIHCLRS